MAGKKLATSKSAFIRSQPATMAGSEVVAKAKAAGIKLSRQLVASVRMSQKWTATQLRGRGRSARERTKKSSSVNRSSFVRRVAALTLAEREVARLASEGLSNGDVAKARGTSVNTVARQMLVILRKLGIASRQVLAARVWQDRALGHAETLGRSGRTSPSPSRVAAAWRDLTVRERQVLRLLARNLTYKIVARKLDTSPTTVSVTFQSACGRLRSVSRPSRRARGRRAS